MNSRAIPIPTKNNSNESIPMEELLSQNAQLLLENRFLLMKDDGMQETPTEMCGRVAQALASTEEESVQSYWNDRFFNVMSKLQFHPGSRVMANAGTSNPQLANCFVLPLNDSREEILRVFQESCDIKSNGGGCGFNYSNIRPKGDKVNDCDELACGPVSLLDLFDSASGIFRQKGRYESGNMAILNVSHPDIIEFIKRKEKDGSLSLTNISVGIEDTFMKAVENDRPWELINPRNKEVVNTVDATKLFADICQYAWETGDPGLIFLDTINKTNPLLDSIGPIEATNTCGEIALFPYESCNLGYINLEKFLIDCTNNKQDSDEIFDKEKLKNVIQTAVRMVDNTITASWYPIPAIKNAVSSNRRIGIGLTGWADCLSVKGIPYDSDLALRKADELASDLYSFANETSIELAKEKGAYPNSVYNKNEARRNISLIALPPSGNNAIIFDSSFSIEPHFSMAYSERIMGGTIIHYRNRQLEKTLKAMNLNVENVFRKIEENKGSLKGIIDIPENIRACYKTAHDIEPEMHIKMQAAFQKHVDNAVTKTVNLPTSANIDDVKNVYMSAWKLACKGVTIYRNGSRSEQAIEFTKHEEKNSQSSNPATCVVCET